jgi:hypothetical protein
VSLEALKPGGPAFESSGSSDEAFLGIVEDPEDQHVMA